MISHLTCGSKPPGCAILDGFLRIEASDFLRSKDKIHMFKPLAIHGDAGSVTSSLKKKHIDLLDIVTT